MASGLRGGFGVEGKVSICAGMTDGMYYDLQILVGILDVHMYMNITIIINYQTYSLFYIVGMV